MSDSLWLHGLRHARFPCALLPLRICSNSCPLSRWCYLTISFCCPLLLLPSIIPSIRVFSNGLALCIRRPKYWSLSFSISPSNEYSGLISFRIDWFDLLADWGTLKSLLQHHIFSPSDEYSGLISFRIDWFDLLADRGTLKSLLQHHILKASVLRRSTFMFQLSQPYMTTGKTIALTIQSFVDKVMSLLFNVLSRFVIIFLPRGKFILISWLQSLSTLDWSKITGFWSPLFLFLFVMKWWGWILIF